MRDGGDKTYALRYHVFSFNIDPPLDDGCDAYALLRALAIKILLVDGYRLAFQIKR